MKRTLPAPSAEAGSVASKKPRCIDEDSGIAPKQRVYPDDDADLLAAVPCETEAAIQLVTSRFPSAAVLGGSVPPLALKHQLYAIVNDRTLVDRQLVELSQRGTVQLFQLTTGSSDEYAVAFQSDFKRYVVQRCAATAEDTTIAALLDKLLAGCRGHVTVSRKLIKDELDISESDLTALVSMGILTMCNVNAWYLAIPNASIFVKALTKGRQLVLRAVRLQRHHEILQSDLEKRHIVGVRLGMIYHIYDIKGGDYVTSVQTTSGDLLRLTEEVIKKKRR